MKTFGMEMEFFCSDHEQNLRLPPHGSSCDEFPLALEVRSAPHTCIYYCVSDIIRFRAALEVELEKNKLIPLYIPRVPVSKELHEQIIRDNRLNKRAIKYRNLYGKKLTPNWRIATAGIHIHFSNLASHKTGCKECGVKEYTTTSLLDIPFIVRTLDKMYEKEIKEASRLPGEYELKGYGGFEYRSLPNNIDLWKLAENIEGMKWE